MHRASLGLRKKKKKKKNCSSPSEKEKGKNFAKAYRDKSEIEILETNRRGRSWRTKKNSRWKMDEKRNGGSEVESRFSGGGELADAAAAAGHNGRENSRNKSNGVAKVGGSADLGFNFE